MSAKCMEIFGYAAVQYIYSLPVFLLRGVALPLSPLGIH